MKNMFVAAAVLLLAWAVYADNPSCPMAAHKPGCCMKSAAASGEMPNCCAMQTEDKAFAEHMAEMMKTAKEVEITGKLYCASCDLKIEKKCTHVLQSGEVNYHLLTGTEMMNLCKAASHGSKLVKVKANLAEMDGKKYLQVIGFEEVTEKAT
ncbi:MAG: hypothetical protein AB1714_04695 [Acidobacteriota bacterium]